MIILTLILISIQSAYADECLNELKKIYSSLEIIVPKYAKNFKLYKSKNFIYLKINKLWTGDLNGKGYFLQTKPKNLKLCHSEKLIIGNAKRIIPLSTTYVAFLEALKIENKIIGFPNLKFINSPRTKKLITKNKIKNLAYPLNIEEVIKLDPDLIISYSSSSPEILGLDKIERLTKKTVYFPEYLEKHPLGRAEWIIVLGYLTSKKEEAEIFFNHVKTQYLKLKKMYLKSDFKRTVLLGTKNAGDWKAPEKDSYLATLIKDAGGVYILDEKSNKNLKFEEILKLRSKIDFWLPHTVWSSHKDILNEDKKYQLLFSDTNIKVYNASKKSSADAGFDFWETGLSRPDLILKDLITMFNHKNQKDLILKWYKKL
jgi:iron complex transport system substrate-binding protein